MADLALVNKIEKEIEQAVEMQTEKVIKDMVRRSLSLDHFKRKINEKPLIKVEIPNVIEGEILVCYRKDNIPLSTIKELNLADEKDNVRKLDVIAETLAEFALDEHGDPLGTVSDWSQFQMKYLFSIINALFGSTNSAGEA